MRNAILKSNRKATMRPLRSTFALFSIVLAAPLSQVAAQTPGMQVVDTNGGVVGTVSGVMGDLVVVKTDRHEVSLPKASFTPDQGQLLFGMTQAELNAATDKSLADVAAALVAGATVKGSGGQSVGTIDAIDAEYATIKLTSGKLVRIPRSGLGASAEGAVIGLTAAQLEAQAAPTETPASS